MFTRPRKISQPPPSRYYAPVSRSSHNNPVSSPLGAFPFAAPLLHALAVILSRKVEFRRQDNLDEPMEKYSFMVFAHIYHAIVALFDTDEHETVAWLALLAQWKTNWARTAGNLLPVPGRLGRGSEPIPFISYIQKFCRSPRDREKKLRSARQNAHVGTEHISRLSRRRRISQGLKQATVRTRSGSVYGSRSERRPSASGPDRPICFSSVISPPSLTRLPFFLTSPH